MPSVFQQHLRSVIQKPADTEEGTIDAEQMFMMDLHATELPEPSVGSVHDPAAPITPQFAFIFIAPGFETSSVGCVPP
jgi:hypothetical protein